MAELNPVNIEYFLDWFKTTKFAEHYPDEIAGITSVYEMLNEIARDCPAAEDVCTRIRNRYNLSFYNELKEDHKKWVNENSPATKRISDFKNLPNLD